mmetsp:Transcript_5752/g.15358  ORF Transcript_5752/g.15358 Transcript_5752/m.15358 type:complete len:357 (-) Transcript_5752:1279-2349(-)
MQEAARTTHSVLGLALRRLMKWLWHVVTGKPEILRIASAAAAAERATSNDVRNSAASRDTLDLELAFVRALRRSRQLSDAAEMLGLQALPAGVATGASRGRDEIAQWLELVNDNNPSTRHAHLEAVLRVIVERKRIAARDTNVHDQLRSLLQRALHVGEAVQAALLLRAIPFSKENPDHELLLKQLWRQLTDGAPQPEGRSSREWSRIGFQGANPATDFRGGGELALRQLVFFANEFTLESRRYLQEPHNELARYPFACCGIGLSDAIARMASRGALDAVLLRAAPSGRMRELDVVYASAWRTFHEMYIAAAPATVMDFPPLYNRAMSSFERELFEHGTLDKIQLISPRPLDSKHN